MTDDKLASIVDRIERLEEEQKAVLAATGACARGQEGRPRRQGASQDHRQASHAAGEPRAGRGRHAQNYRVALGMAMNNMANSAKLNERGRCQKRHSRINPP